MYDVDKSTFHLVENLYIVLIIPKNINNRIIVSINIFIAKTFFFITYTFSFSLSSKVANICGQLIYWHFYSEYINRGCYWIDDTSLNHKLVCLSINIVPVSKSSKLHNFFLTSKFCVFFYFYLYTINYRFASFVVQKKIIKINLKKLNFN